MIDVTDGEIAKRQLKIQQIYFLPTSKYSYIRRSVTFKAAFCNTRSPPCPQLLSRLPSLIHGCPRLVHRLIHKRLCAQAPLTSTLKP
jgi:hypothetical protein